MHLEVGGFGDLVVGLIGLALFLPYIIICATLIKVSWKERFIYIPITIFVLLVTNAVYLGVGNIISEKTEKLDRENRIEIIKNNSGNALISTQNGETIYYNKSEEKLYLIKENFIRESWNDVIPEEYTYLSIAGDIKSGYIENGKARELEINKDGIKSMFFVDTNDNYDMLYVLFEDDRVSSALLHSYEKSFLSNHYEKSKYIEENLQDIVIGIREDKALAEIRNNPNNMLISTQDNKTIYYNNKDEIEGHHYNSYYNRNLNNFVIIIDEKYKGTEFYICMYSLAVNSIDSLNRKDVKEIKVEHSDAKSIFLEDDFEDVEKRNMFLLLNEDIEKGKILHTISTCYTYLPR